MGPSALPSLTPLEGARAPLPQSSLSSRTSASGSGLAGSTCWNMVHQAKVRGGERVGFPPGSASHFLQGAPELPF